MHPLVALLPPVGEVIIKLLNVAVTVEKTVVADHSITKIVKTMCNKLAISSSISLLMNGVEYGIVCDNNVKLEKTTNLFLSVANMLPSASTEIQIKQNIHINYLHSNSKK